MERAIQAELVTRLNYLGLHFCHIPNERQTSLAQGAMLKKQGVKKGVPDLLIFNRPNLIIQDYHVWTGLQWRHISYYNNSLTYNGVALEVKSLNGKINPEQIKWLNILESENWFVTYAYGLDECLSKLRLLWPKL